MKDDVAKLVERLDDGICDDWCKVRDAKSGCACAEAASTIRAQAAEIERLRADKTLLIEAPATAVEDTQAAEAKLLEAIGKAERQWEGWVKEEVRRKAAEAKLREAVGLLQGWYDAKSTGRHEPLEIMNDATGNFLATMEKTNDKG